MKHNDVNNYEESDNFGRTRRIGRLDFPLDID